MNSKSCSIKQSEFDEELVKDINICSLPSSLGYEDSLDPGSPQFSRINFLSQKMQKKIEKKDKKKVRLKLYKTEYCFYYRLKPF